MAGVRGMRSSIYDINNKCNLKCKGCFYFSSGQDKVDDQKDLGKLREFIEDEKSRGVNYAILIGGEPSLSLDRLDIWYANVHCSAATNGVKKIPRERYPKMRIGISLWGDEEYEKQLRGKNTFKISRENYKNDPNVYYLYTITPGNSHQIEPVTKKIEEAGLRVHYQLFSNDEHVPGFDWSVDEYKRARDKMDAMLEKYPHVVVSSKYYHQVLTAQTMLGRRFGWMECPSVSEEVDDREPKVKRLMGFNSYASDLKTIHRCCTSITRDCSTCHDGAATMSWIMVNKREHMHSPEDFANWIDVTYMFAKLYEYAPW
ncbi:MAG: 4Fe-4S cluster-binding domain-containing protein [Proteobacteria bacterium]|nr:4Fe-4S cluster-binding domain-containing protein [Pseudomonadota bacterium]